MQPSAHNTAEGYAAGPDPRGKEPLASVCTSNASIRAFSAG